MLGVHHDTYKVVANKFDSILNQIMCGRDENVLMFLVRGYMGECKDLYNKEI